jgi:hypothetical protein
VVRTAGRMPRSERLARSDRTSTGIHIGLGAMAVLPALMASALLPAQAGGWRLVPVAAVLALIGALTVDPVAVAAVTALAYLLVVGFLVNRYGVLTWQGVSDLHRLVFVWGASGIGLAFGAILLGLSRRRRFKLPRAWAAGGPAASAIASMNGEDVPGV